jgi:histidinol phosphatase-like PHP family hydrolase
MYKLYCSFVEKINILNASNLTGDFNNLECKDIEQVNKLNEEINCIDDEIDKLKITIKKEVQFNKRMDINIKIKKLETKRNNLIEEIKS